MKTIFLVRHAKSSWKDLALDDIDRPLNKRGKRDAPFMGKLLLARGVQPDLLLSSPARRARTTASHFAEALGQDDEAVVVRNRLYEGGPEDILRVIRGLDDALETVLLFAHNPTLTSLANRFSPDYIANVPTCGIVHLESTAPAWSSFGPDNTRMRAFYFPKQYLT